MPFVYFTKDDASTVEIEINLGQVSVSGEKSLLKMLEMVPILLSTDLLVAIGKCQGINTHQV